MNYFWITCPTVSIHWVLLQGWLDNILYGHCNCLKDVHMSRFYPLIFSYRIFAWTPLHSCQTKHTYPQIVLDTESYCFGVKFLMEAPQNRADLRHIFKIGPSHNLKAWYLYNLGYLTCISPKFLLFYCLICLNFYTEIIIGSHKIAETMQRDSLYLSSSFPQWWHLT